MGRKIRRVPLDFDHPTGEVWTGFLMPERLRQEACDRCNGSGQSRAAKRLHDRWYGNAPFDPAETGSTPFTADHPTVRAKAVRNTSYRWTGIGEAPIPVDNVSEWRIRDEAQRLVDFYNGAWSHHLNQDDVDALVAAGRLHDFTHECIQGEGWKRIDPAPTVTAQQVNEWSLDGLGHDGINCWIVIKAACERQGIDPKCPACDGHGYTERYPGQRAEAEAWEEEEPPEGDGWQLWETVSEGSPISPVFPTAEALAEWIADPDRPGGRDWMPYPAALKFVLEGWAPSLVAGPGIGVVSGAEYIGLYSEGETP